MYQIYSKSMGLWLTLGEIYQGEKYNEDVQQQQQQQKIYEFQI